MTRKRTCMNAPEKMCPFGPVGKSFPVLIGHPIVLMPIQARGAVGGFQTILLSPHNDLPNARDLPVPRKPVVEQRPDLRPKVGALGH